MQNATCLFIAVISIRQTSKIRSRLMAIPLTDIQILFTNYDIIAYFLNLASCSEHFISIKHRILATFNINKKNQFEQLYAFK
jgi:hypothetical protein